MRLRQEADRKTVAALGRIVGPEHVSTRKFDRINYSRDLWPLTTIWLFGDEVHTPPDVIVWPADTAQVAEVVRFAQRNGHPLIPYGAGSGVCGGALPVRGGIIIDMKRMNRVLELDEVAMTARVQPGMIGQDFENWLNDRGFTLGNFPSSIYCSSVGGWAATRAAGQYSSKYGKFEDMLRGAEMVLPSGEIYRMPERAAKLPITGIPDLFLGSEGTLGIFTELTVRVNRYPEARRLRGIQFPTMHDGLEAMRLLLQAGLDPMVLRLYDELDTFLVGSGKGDGAFSKLLGAVRSGGKAKTEEKKEAPEPEVRGGQKTPGSTVFREVSRAVRRRAVGTALGYAGIMNKAFDLTLKECLLILGFEGNRRYTEAQEKLALEICAEAKGRDLGTAPGERWLRKRHSVSYRLSIVYDQGIFADTIEVATTWDKLETLYHTMRDAVASEALIMAHFSHAYPEGCSIYFTFAGSSASPRTNWKQYAEIWKRAMDACTAVGGTISHHHGVGVLKAPWMEQELGGAMPLLRAAKAVLDPKDLHNPSKLGLGPVDLPQWPLK
ncbi:MAG: FAD-binding oxidoreductase [Myxococcales bacterium]|nr:FAD-binding oxidoreductase [Myxococcales bacterium]